MSQQATGSGVEHSKRTEELVFKRQAFDKALFDDDDKHVRAVIELRKRTAGALAFYQ